MKKILKGKKTEHGDRAYGDAHGRKGVNRLLRFLRGKSKIWRTVMTALAVVVIFITTYGLVLPAITIEKDTAKKMPGIHLASDSSHDKEERTSGDHERKEDEDSDKNDSDSDKVSEEDAKIEDGSQEDKKSEDTAERSDDKVEYLSEPLVYHGQSYDISLSLEEEDHIPKGTVLVVDTLPQTSKDYTSCQEALKNKQKDLTQEAFFRIRLMNDGTEIKPDQPVDITISRKTDSDHNADRGLYFRDGEKGLKAHAVTPEYYVKGVKQKDADFQSGKAGTEIVLKQIPLNRKRTLSIIGIAYRKNADSPDSSAEKSGSGQDSKADAADDDEDAEVPALVYPKASFQAKTRNLEISVEAPEGALPEGTTMRVREVAKEEVIDSIAKAIEEPGNQAEGKNKADNKEKDETDRAEGKTGKKEVRTVYAADITFTDPEGHEIEPAKAIRVTLTSKIVRQAAANDDQEIAAVHLDDQGKTCLMDIETEKDQVSFDAESFSVYALVQYTVDFHWEVDGKEYEFSIPGGGFVSLAQMTEALGITRDTDEARKFVADVESAEFSAPDLMDISKAEEELTIAQIKERRGLEVQYSEELTDEQIEEINRTVVKSGDWALISMQPFTSEEALKITMKNGDLFTIQITDAQIRTHVISDSGDTYKITVTYDDVTGIPADAELRVRQLTPDDERYHEDIERSNTALMARYDQEVTNPVIFEIKIFANDEEIEPREGTRVSVEITLDMEMVARGSKDELEDIEEETIDTLEGNDVIEDDAEEGSILINGVEYTLDSMVTDPNTTRVVHLTDDGEAEVIENLDSMVNADNDVVMTFDTESFSDYTIQGVTNNYGLNGLPDTIYVGDEIYMQNCSDMWVTGIGSVVTETKYNNNSDNYKSVRATSPGIFRICHKNDWNNGNTGYKGQYNGKYITVLPARSEGNNGQPYSGTTPPATIETVSNASIGLTLNLFDYDLDDYLDNRFNNKDYGSTEGGFVGHGINDGNALKFWGSGITDSSYGSHNNYVEHGVTSIVSNTLNSSGYPQVASNAGYSGGGGNKDLSYLFTPSDGTDKKAYTNVNGLFKKEGDYYVYDSDQNYAWYNPTTNSFDVYNGTYKQKLRGDGGEQSDKLSDKNIGFFPFHKWDDQYDLFVNWNKNLNHHFGMSMSVDFSLPKDPKAVLDSNGQPIIFDFSGDDDLWVFIDGKLAMDIGGIHQPTSGTINFQTGVVTVNGSTQLTNNQFNSRFPNLYDGKKHTMQVFYIERGGCDSNCKIKFNMTQYGDVEFEKVDADDENIKLAGAVFGLYKDDRCTQPLMERLKDGTERAFVVETGADGKAKLEGIPLGDYYLKEIHAPDGYPISVGGEAGRVRVYLDENGNVKASINGAEQAKITNKKPQPISLGVKKEWQNSDGETISAPNEATATFELKRIRTYEIYTEEKIEGQDKQSSHLVVGWIHDNKPYEYEEFDLIAGSQTTVSWSYADGYQGTVKSELNGVEETKPLSANNIYSRGFTMPAAGETAIFYIMDDSEHGEAIRNINVAGSQFYGNSGGGYIHTFHTITEQDTDFRYTGDHVTDNRVTLPISENTWQYNFTNLPTFGTGTVNVEGQDQKVAYRYSYYLEEVSSTSPEGTTVIYRDLHNNVISSPTKAETAVSGTLNITNKVPTGYLRIDKEVTYNGVAPTTDTQKSALAGTYTFKVFTDENCTKPYKVIRGEEPNQQETELTLTIEIADDGTAKSSETVKLPIGSYWIEEQTPSQTGVTPEENRIAITVTADNTTAKPAIASFTNNKEESDNPDELAIELEKTFTGLQGASKIPSNYQATLTYKVGADTVKVPLTGATQGNVTCIKSNSDMTWHWRVTQIPKDATDFGVYESNYDIPGYTRITKINGTVVANPGTPQTVTVLRPGITMTNITKDYTTEDNNKVFRVVGNQILLVRMTNHATVIVSPKSLSLATRQAIEKMITDNDGKIPGDSGANAQWVTNFVYFSHEIQGDSFSYGGRTIFFDGDNVKIPHKSSSHEVRVDIGYTSESAENSFTIENEYTEIPTEVDVLKVEKGKETTTKLSGAVFELRKLEDAAPTVPGGTLEYVKDNNQQVIVTSKETGDNGKLTFPNLTQGVYEIREVTPPPGYVKSEDVIFYLRVDGGTITYVQKGSSKPSEWLADPNNDPTATVYYMEAKESVEDNTNTPEDEAAAAVNATFRVGNEPGSALPSTGGPGTRMIYLLGGILAIGAGLFLLSRRKMIKKA